MPVAGRKELATDIFVNAWKQIENVIPKARSFEYVSVVLTAIEQPLTKNVPNKQTTNKQPKKPNSSAITAKM